MHPILDLLRRDDRCELCDNRMTLYAPAFGLGSVHFWDGSWDNDEDQTPRQCREIFENRDGELEVVGAGGEMDPLRPDRREWWPHLISTRFVGSRQAIWQENKAIHQDVAVDVIRFKGGGLTSRRVVVRHRIDAAPGLRIRKIDGLGVAIVATQDQYARVHRVIGFAGADKVSIRSPGAGMTFVEAPIELLPERWSQLTFVVACDEDPDEALRRFRAAVRSPQAVLDGARRRWERFFDRNVPAFDCDNATWVKLFYHSAYVLRANLYDFRKGAIRHPYSCPSKMKFLPSWFWDPCFHGFSEKWLRDYPAPLSTFQNHFDAQESDGYLPMTLDCHGNTWRRLGAADKACQQFLHPITIWDHYLVHGDRRALRRALPHLVRHDDYLRRHREPGPDPMFVPAGGGELADNSSRLVADTAQRDQIGTLSRRIEPIDWNTFQYVSQRCMVRIAREIGDRAAERAMTDRADARLRVLRRLWNPRTGLFTDRSYPDGRLSNQRFAESLVALLGGFATASQSRSTVRFLLDERHLWTRFPIPTLPISDPAFDCEDTYNSYWNGRVWPSLNWCAIEGLCRAGQRTVARQLLSRTLEMHVCTGQPWCMENFHPLEPTRYAPPHSIFNQGWGAACLDLILRRGLGLQPDAPRQVLHVSPLGLPGVSGARVNGIPFGGGAIDVELTARPGTRVRLRGRREVRVRQDSGHWLDF